MQTITKYLLFLLVIPVLVACSDMTHIYVTVTHPSEINMSSYKRITVDDFTEDSFRGRNYARTSTNELISALVQSNYFEVLDKRNLMRILSENNLTLAGLSNTNNSSKIPETMKSLAMVSGNITRYDYNQDIKESEPYKDDRGKMHKEYTVTGKAVVAVGFRVIDLQSGKIIYANTIEKVSNVSEKKIDYKPEIDVKFVQNGLRIDVVNEFIRKIVPYSEKKSIYLYVNDENESMKSGLTSAKVGNWDGAIDFYTKATKQLSNSNQLASKAFYNLGITYQYSYRFNQAVACFENALSLFNDSNYYEAITKCREMEAEYKKLLEQQK
jgi:tetratricopeptide (TPR) repeat protein